MSTPLEAYRAEIAAITSRINVLETLKTEVQDEVVAEVPSHLVTERFPEELGRVIDTEINWLRYKKNETSIAFAESNL